METTWSPPSSEIVACGNCNFTYSKSFPLNTTDQGDYSNRTCPIHWLSAGFVNCKREKGNPRSNPSLKYNPETSFHSCRALSSMKNHVWHFLCAFQLFLVFLNAPVVSPSSSRTPTTNGGLYTQNKPTSTSALLSADRKRGFVAGKCASLKLTKEIWVKFAANSMLQVKTVNFRTTAP